MSDELNAAQAAPSEEYDELSTTPPNPALEEVEEETGWKMPKPVFRKTSGYLPQGFAEKLSQAEGKEKVDDDASAGSTEKPVGLVDVEPQPELHESDPGFNYSPAIEKPMKKGSAAKIFFTVLGLLLALLLVAAFVGVVYFLFFSPSYDATF